MNKAGPKLQLIIAMVAFGTIGIFRRSISVGSATLAMTRGLIGTLALLCILLLTKQKLNFPAIRRNFWRLVASGTCIGLNWILLFEAYAYTTVAVATLCYYMAPVFVILVSSPLFFHEKLTRKKLLCTAAAFAGMILVSGVLTQTSATNLRGVAYGLAAALFYAGVITLNKTIRDIPAYDKTILQLFSAAVVMVPYVLLKEQPTLADFTPTVVILLLVVGIFHTGITYALYFNALGHLPAQTVALFGYIDPIVAILLSAFLLHEAMGVLEVIGTLMILSATILSDLPTKQKEA